MNWEEKWFDDNVKPFLNDIALHSVIKVGINDDADEGFVLYFDNGVELHAGWSGCEGYVRFKAKGDGQT